MQNNWNVVCAGKHLVLKIPLALLFFFWSTNWSLVRFPVVKCYSTFQLNLREVSWSCQCEVIYVGDTFPLLIFQTPLMSYIWDDQMFCRKVWSTFCRKKKSMEEFWKICSTLSKVTFVFIHLLFREVLLPFWGMNEICGTYG